MGSELMVSVSSGDNPALVSSLAMPDRPTRFSRKWRQVGN